MATNVPEGWELVLAAVEAVEGTARALTHELNRIRKNPLRSIAPAAVIAAQHCKHCNELVEALTELALVHLEAEPPRSFDA